MSVSPEDPHSAFLLSMLSRTSADPAVVREARDFLVKRDADPCAGPATPVEEGAALLRDWSAAAVAGDTERAGRVAAAIESRAPASPFPFRTTLAEYHKADFANAMTAGPGGNYRPYGGDLSFGVIAGEIADDAKLAILGDWGTGGEDAFYLLDSLLTQHPDIGAILHLGDIYHSGTMEEVAGKFIGPIQNTLKRKNLQVPVYAVPGDHEYISGGAGFYHLIDTINGGLDAKWRQAASYYCLRTTGGKWQFLGADTGFNPEGMSQPGLLDSERVWHEDKVNHFSGKTVLMTHRQFASAYDRLDGDHFNHALGSSLRQILPKTRLFLWGHEHRFVPFADGLAAPGFSSMPATLRLLGGSARETRAGYPHAPSMVKQAGGRGPVWNGTENGYSNHTYAILDLGAETIAYYEASAWDGPNPVKSAPTQPLLVDSL